MDSRKVATPTVQPCKPSKTAREKLHARIDEFLDIAEREQLWGNVKPDILLQQGRIVKADVAAVLGEKFD